MKWPSNRQLSFLSSRMHNRDAICDMVSIESFTHFNIPSCGEQHPCSGNGCHHLSLKNVHTYLMVHMLVKETDGRLWRITTLLEQNHVDAWT